MLNVLRTASLLSLLMMLNSCNDPSRVEVVTRDGISNHDIEISMEVLADLPKTKIFKDGESYRVPDGYGEHEWYFTHKDKDTGSLRHFNTNRNDHYRYRFDFFRHEENKIAVEARIMGIDTLHTTVYLEVKGR